MDPNYSLSSPQIQAVLGEMATLTRMERGTLREEYRTGACAPGADPVRLGPFYRHQLWEGGRNVSRRVPPEQVPGLKADLANHQRFTQLTAAFEEATIALIRQQRGQPVEPADYGTAKKTPETGRTRAL